MSLSDIDFNLAIARSRPQQCRTTIGVHPYHAAEPEGDEAYFEKLFDHVQALRKEEPSLIAAFGELGLDYDHVEKASKEVQIKAFTRQLEMFAAAKLDLPLFLHCRAAFDDFVATIELYLPVLPRRGVVHSFVGSVSQMQKLVEMAFDISVNGFSFRGRESLEMVKEIPLDRLQIETDAPWGEIPTTSEVAERYLVHVKPLPQSKRKDKFERGLMVKSRNESCSIERVAFIVAGLKGLGVEDVAERAWENSVRMFRLT